jgi:antibiotic biosynthesis monooxygenase (ABM) superfamily enzyme
MWRGGEVDTIFGFDEADAIHQWIKEKSQAWLIDQRSGR